MSIKFVPDDPIHNKSALVQVMVWCRSDHTIAWTKDGPQFSDAYASLGLSYCREVS